MPKRKKVTRRAKKALDTYSVKRRRGRPGVDPSEVSGRSQNYRFIFNQIWKDVGEALLKAKTEKEVREAFDPTPGYKQEFSSLATLILRVINEPKFPKRPGPRGNFLADSLAGVGRISPRRSRDICGQERTRQQKET